MIFLQALGSGQYYHWLITWFGLAELESAYTETDESETTQKFDGKKSMKKPKKLIKNKHDSDLFFGIFEDFGQLLVTTINSLILGKTLTYMQVLAGMSSAMGLLMKGGNDK